MALIDIIKKIDKEAANKIAQLEKDFERKKQSLEDTYKKKQKALDEEIHTKIEEKNQKILEKTKMLGEMEAKNILLKEKRAIIGETVDQAIETLASSDKLEDILVSMLKNVDIDSENIVITPAKGKEEVTKKAIKAAGKDFFLSDKSANIKGGFIVKTEKIEIDNSFETIIKEQLKEVIEIELNKTLF